jgi:hypothetical protein
VSTLDLLEARRGRPARLHRGPCRGGRGSRIQPRRSSTHSESPGSNRSVLPSDTITARSIRFSSSRTLPGQS